MPAIIRRPHLLRLSLGAVAALALPAALGVSDSSARVQRLVVQRAAVMPAGDRGLGALPASTGLDGAVVLRPRDAGSLTHFIARVSDPSSSDYGHFLPAGAFATRFGPTAAMRGAVVHALRAEGLRVGVTSSDGLIVPFSGTTADVEQAFHTTIHAVAMSGGGEGHATSSPVSLPATLAPSVAAVVGLDDTVRPQRIGAPQSAAGTAAARRAPRIQGARAAADVATSPAGPRACPAASSDALANNGLTDDAVAGAYGASGLYAAGDTGSGEHIAVYELEPFLRSDVHTFDSCYFGAAAAAQMMRRLHVVGVDGGAPTGTGSGEASLDVEDLSAIAPGASIDVYVGPSANDYDGLDEYAQIVDRDRDRIVSSSWGECEQALQRGGPGEQAAENLLFEQAAAQGQTVFAAAGDSGSDDCNARSDAPASGQDPVSVDDPGSQPYVVSVGGTALTDADPSDLVEHAWNDGAAYGAGGGGISDSWAMPAWQRAARVPGIAQPGDRTYRDADALEEEAGYAPGFCQSQSDNGAGTPCRLVPDVSAQADEFTGAITVYSREYVSHHDPSGWSTVGGTSSAAPIWAASLALIDSSASCESSAVTRAHGVGFAAPLLYDVASDPARYAASFTDVQTGNNDIYGLAAGQVFPAGHGYDLATGLGSPRLSGPDGTAGLAAAMCGLSASGTRPTVTRVSPRSTSSAGGARVTIHGSGFTAGDRARVAGVQFGDVWVSRARVDVLGNHSLTLTVPSAHRAIPVDTPTAASAGLTADVTVSLTDGSTSAPGPSAVLHYLDETAHSARPTVQEVSPSGGFSGGGSSVTVLGTGFTGARSVTLGGVPVPFRVRSAHRITLRAPSRSADSRCVALPHRGVYRHESANNDICQVYVSVRGAHGTSPRARIRPPYEGSQATDSLGIVRTPSDCGCEVAEAPDEFDYVPRPHVNSVSTDSGANSLADEHGGTVITVHGSGLTPSTLAYAAFGNSRRYSSEATSYLYATGTEMQLRAPRQSITAAPDRVAFSVRTLGGRSNAIRVTYAGVPAVTRVVNLESARNIDGVWGGPDTGGTPLRLFGRGLGSQALGVEFLQPGDEPFSVGTQYLFTRPAAGQIFTRTVSENPAIVAVEVCTVTGCTKPGSGNRFWLYAAGTPTVDAVSPTSGPPSGGSSVTIVGQSLGCALSASFGTVTTTTLTPVKTLLPCGSSNALTVSAPAGAAGSTVPVTVQTAESFYTGSRPLSTASFTYP